LARQQLAEQQRAEELARQQLAEQQRARQLVEQRAAEERARKATRQQAEQLAREQAVEAARQLARQQALDAPGSGAAQAVTATAAAAGPGSGLDGAGGRGGPGQGGGVLPGAVAGGGLGSRARDMLRGIDIGKAVPPAMLPAQETRHERRALAQAGRNDVPLRLYIDGVRQKIERNAVVGMNQLAEDVARSYPVVSIAIRSDGSVEDVTIVRSSGRPDLDDVVRRIVRLNARYAAFPPNVAARYDVVELRRVWNFAGVLRLLEEMR